MYTLTEKELEDIVQKELGVGFMGGFIVGVCITIIIACCFHCLF